MKDWLPRSISRSEGLQAGINSRRMLWQGSRLDSWALPLADGVCYRIGAFAPQAWAVLRHRCWVPDLRPGRIDHTNRRPQQGLLSSWSTASSPEVWFLDGLFMCNAHGRSVSWSFWGPPAWGHCGQVYSASPSSVGCSRMASPSSSPARKIKDFFGPEGRQGPRPNFWGADRNSGSKLSVPFHPRKPASASPRL